MSRVVNSMACTEGRTSPEWGGERRINKVKLYMTSRRCAVGNDHYCSSQPLKTLGEEREGRGNKPSML